ncbi:MAG: anthranilate phosphoribosyltransferase [Patescibacteria group bacterium]
MEYLQAITELIEKRSLSRKQSADLFGTILDGKKSEIQAAALLTALEVKGVTTDEVLGSIQALQQRMKTITHGRMVIDTCGTGGDGKNTFNISTATAILATACGAKVAKHGNKAASSRCGSADVLESLGVNIHLKPDQAEEVLKHVGLVFLYAPYYHPSFKSIIDVRRQLGFRTLMNLLGPFLNPARVRRQLIGVPNKKIARLMSDVSIHLNYDHLLVVANDEELDEISLNVPSKVYEIKGQDKRSFTIHPEKLGFQPCRLSDIAGGTPEENASIIRDIVNGQGGPRRDIAVLNTAFTLLVARQVSNVREGIELTTRMIDTGEAAKTLDSLITVSNHYGRHAN